MLPLSNLPQYATFALVSGNSVYIVSSRNAVTEYARNLNLIRLGDHPSPEVIQAYKDGTLELLVLHEFTSFPSLTEVRLQYNIELKKLLAAGYRNLREDYIPIKYKLKHVVMGSFTRDIRRPLVYVYAETMNKDRVILGIFKTLAEANEWCSKTYPSKDNIIPVYHDGELLQMFKKKHGDKLEFNVFEDLFDLDLE